MRWEGIGKIARDGVTFMYSGNSQKRMYGVSICINSHTTEALLTWSSVSNRIITTRFQSRHVKVTVLQAYALINESSDEIKNDFYNLLQDTVNKTPRHDIKSLIGDLNPQIDSNRQGCESTIGLFGSSTSTNNNGEHLKIFCNLNDISIGNTSFKHKRIHKLTWLSLDHLTRN